MADYIEEALVLHALSKTAVTTIVGRRIYQDEAPQGAKRPYIVLNNIAPANESTAFTERNGQPLFQWSCISKKNKTPTDAFLAARAIMDTFYDYQGTMQGITVKMIRVRGVKSMSVPGTTDEMLSIAETDVSYIEP